MVFEEWMERFVRTFEFVGVAILSIGAAATIVWVADAFLRRDPTLAYGRARQGLGRSILLGLEVLIVADIVLTITIESSFESVATLGLLVLVRTFLSFSIEVELDGVLPWRKGRSIDTSSSHPATPGP